MLRSNIYDLGKDEYVLACVFHHIASDGWSSEIFTAEFEEICYALESGNKIHLPELRLQYSDYALWQRNYLEGEILDTQLSYWEKKLKDVEVLALPLDYSRSTTQNNEGNSIAFKLGENLSNSINVLCQQERVTPFMFLLSTFKILLSHYSGQNDICVGTPIANRTQSELEDMIGCFINTLALRTNLSGNPSFKEVLQKVKKTTLDSYDNQLVPFEKVVDRVVSDRDINKSPLFQVMFSHQNNVDTLNEEQISIEEEINEDEFLSISGYETDEVTTQFDLTLNVSEEISEYSLTLAYRTSLYKKSTINTMIIHYHELLNSIINDINTPIKQLQILTKQEEDKLLNTFNDTNFNYSKEETIVDLFKEQVLKTPEAIALSFQGESLTYSELDANSNQLANYLSSKKVKTGTRIAILFNRSFDMITTILGVLKLGCSFVPLDPTFPKNRLLHILKDSEVSHILHKESSLLERLQVSNSIKTLNIERASTHKTTYKKFERDINSEAYVMYTSGTTGVPKGISINDRNIISLINDPSSEISIMSTDRVLQWSNYAFDGSTYEIFGSLLNGAMLKLIGNSIASSAIQLSEVIYQEKLTIVFITTALFNALAEHDKSSLSSLRLLLFGGEKVSVKPVRKMLSALGPDRIVHIYGPTETTTYASSKIISEIPKSAVTIPIGTPLSNTRLYVLNENEKLVPIGAVGELFIAGDGVSKGYLNRMELTQERFVKNPFKEGERMFKTGDLVRCLPDGNIEFIRRKDNQVKIHGYRIELGEIEHVLSEVKGIQNNCVLVKKDASGNKRLVAYVVCDTIFQKEEVQSILKENIPDYMIPMIWIVMDKLPLTSNGKLDKKALPEPSFNFNDKYVAPTNQLEQEFCNIWQDVLGVERIGIKDDFFNVGGNSILAIKVSSEMSKVSGIKVQISDIIRYKSIGILSAIYSKIQAFQNHVSLVMPYEETYNDELANLICIHSALGGSDAYHCLTKLLDNQYNCIGIDNQNIYGKSKIDNLNQLADFYLNEYTQKYSIKEPIILLGWSLGGSIALEMASVLESRGYTGIKVILLDTYVPLPRKSRRRNKFDRKSTHEFISSMFSEEYDDYVERLVDASEAEHVLAQTPISKRLLETEIILFQALYMEAQDSETSTNEELIPIENLGHNNLEHIIDTNKITIVPIHTHHRHILPFQAQFIGEYLSKNSKEISETVEMSNHVS